MSGHRAAFFVCIVLVGIAWGQAVLAVPVDASVRPLPFRPLTGPQERFAASNLTATYERDSTWLLSWKGRRIDLEQLDRHGHFPYGDVPLEPGEKSLVESAQPRQVADVSPSEKEALTPPSAGVQVGIPSAVAATGALLGGLALLVKILTLGI